MPKVHLTDLAVRSLQPPEQGQITYYDQSLPGFGVRMSLGGAKTFVLVHGKRRSRTTIGRYPTISLSDARAKARTLLATQTLHPDQAPTIAFDAAVERFLTVYSEQRNKPSTYNSTKRLLTRHFVSKFKDKPLASISVHDITAILDGLLPTPSECNHAFTALRTFLRWTVRRRYLASNPLEGLTQPAGNVVRDRVLSDQELASVLRFKHQRPQYGVILTLLVLTGQRLSQISHLRECFIDRKNRLVTWPPSLMKNNQQHTIPYGDKLAALLPQSSDLLFPTRHKTPFNDWSSCKKKLDAAVDIPHWTLHDLRRTFSTGHARLGTPPHVVERILAHSTGTVSGVAAIYNRHTYLPEMREALRKWENHLANLIKT